MKVIHKFLRVLTPFSRKQRENKTCAVSKYVYHPNTNTFTKNWADMWDFANFVKSGWSGPKITYFQVLRACSHEPGTVNYPGVMIALTSPSHGELLSRGKFIVIWSLLIYLNSFSFYTDCYRGWILNTFTYFWYFLELFIRKFILNVNNEHAQDYSCPGATFAFCSHGEKLPRQGRLPGVVQRVTHLSKLPRGNEKVMWTVTGIKPCPEAKLTPGSVSCPGAMSCPGITWTGP